MRVKNKLVSGVGINDYDGNVYIHRQAISSYNCWRDMLQRCYSPICQIKHQSYIGCSVCDEWKYFSNFKKFYDLNYRNGFDLDKDILIEGNKIYSPETCVFVPQYINLLLVDCKAASGDLPLGVMANHHSYLAHCCDYNKRITKTFKTIEEAQNWYSITKKRIVKEQATRAFLDNAIKTDVYLALVRREF